MLGILRRCCSLLIQLLVKLIRPLSSAKTPQVSTAAPQDDWSNTGWDQDGGDWEPFSVKVVPNDDKCSSSDNEQVDATREQPETDLFSDMEPVFRKPTKIRVERKEEQRVLDLNKFTVQDTTFQQDETGGELGLWTDDVGGGWEDGVGEDEGDLVRESQEVLREKRKQDRERRRAQQEILRAQLRSGGYAQGLGTRIT